MILKGVDIPRCVVLGEYIVENSATVRDCAQKHGISKSTVHKDITEKLRFYDISLYNQAKTVLAKNKAERHIRGGLATKKKYRKHNLHHKVDF